MLVRLINNETKKVKIKQKYEEYYKLRVELNKLSKELKFGYGQLPKKFTEGICIEIFSLEKSDDQSKGDAICNRDGKKKYIEIKSTQGHQKCVSINKNIKFDVLMWLNIDYYNEFTIKLYTPQQAQDCIDTLNATERDKERPTINLEKLGTPKKEYKFEFQYDEKKS